MSCFKDTFVVSFSFHFAFSFFCNSGSKPPLSFYASGYQSFIHLMHVMFKETFVVSFSFHFAFSLLWQFRIKVAPSLTYELMKLIPSNSRCMLLNVWVNESKVLLIQLIYFLLSLLIDTMCSFYVRHQLFSLLIDTMYSL
jgi:hypothetical protein